jgi:hypothetical protein
MPRFSAGDLCAAPTTTLPSFAIFSGAAKNAKLVEIGVTNVHATLSVPIYLARLSTAGTSTGLTEAPHAEGTVAVCTAVRDFTGTAPTLGDDLGYRIELPPKGAVQWTFDGQLETYDGTGNGIAVLLENGTGQQLQVYGVWDE